MSKRLDAIRQRLTNATPGPWPKDYVYAIVRNSVRNGSYDSDEPGMESFSWDFSYYYDRADDVPLIAHAPEDLAFLLAEVESLRSMIRVIHEEDNGLWVWDHPGLSWVKDEEES